MDYLLSLLLDLLLTAIIYLFVPVIFIIIGKHHRQSTLKWIAVINGVSIYLFFLIINLSNGSTSAPNVVAATFWSYIAYKILQKRCLKNDFITKSVVVPVFNYIPAGVPIEALDDIIIDTEEITEELANTGDFFALQIQDNSMEPKFSKGDIAIVRKQVIASSSDIVIVTTGNDNAICRKLQLNLDGMELHPTNSNYDSLYFNSNEITETPVRIIGKVVELRSKF